MGEEWDYISTIRDFKKAYDSVRKKNYMTLPLNPI
jgi:hypothetical protein